MMVLLKKELRLLLIKKLRKNYYDIGPIKKREEIVDFLRMLHPFKSEQELIRLGPNTDGGYLLPNDLVGIEACFSPGVDTVSGFELECINRGIKVMMADKSVDKPNLDISEDKYSFLKKYIGYTNDNDFITMDRWVNSSNLSEDSDLILQMDIEGAEYLSLINTSDELMKRFRIMIVEFHDLEQIWNPFYFNIINSVFKKILKTHYCVHIHPNNTIRMDVKYDIEIPRFAEFTFIRKDRMEKLEYNHSFPHELDFDNTGKKSIVLPKYWYRNILNLI